MVLAIAAGNECALEFRDCSGLRMRPVVDCETVAIERVLTPRLIVCGRQPVGCR
jgi:hypothetical protein